MLARVQLMQNVDAKKLVAKVIAQSETPGGSRASAKKRAFIATSLGLIEPLAKKDPDACLMLAQEIQSAAITLASTGDQFRGKKLADNLADQVIRAIPHVINTHPQVALELARMDRSGDADAGHPERYNMLMARIPSLAAQQPVLAMQMGANILGLADTAEKLGDLAAITLPLIPKALASGDQYAPERAFSLVERLYEKNSLMPVSNLKPILVDAALLMMASHEPQPKAVHASFTTLNNKPASQLSALLLADNPNDERVVAASLKQLKMRAYQWPSSTDYEMATKLVELRGIDVEANGTFACRDFAVLASSNPDLPKPFVVFFSADAGMIAANNIGNRFESRHLDAFASAALSDGQSWLPAVQQDRINITKRDLAAFAEHVSARNELGDFAAAVQQHKKQSAVHAL